MEEGLDVLKLCFAGEPFSYEGKRYQFSDVAITPGYVQEGGHHCGLLQCQRQALTEWQGTMHTSFRKACDNALLSPGSRRLKLAGGVQTIIEKGIIRSVLVTDDLDREWGPRPHCRTIPHAAVSTIFRGKQRRIWRGGEAIPQTWIVGNVSECIDQLESFVRAFGITDLVTMAVPPGMPVECVKPQPRAVI